MKKFHKVDMWRICFLLIFFVLIFIFIISHYKDKINKLKDVTDINSDNYKLIEWLKANTKESDVILTQWTYAPFIYGMADRSVIVTTKVYPSEVAVVGERYADLARFFFAQDEKDALVIVKKYNATYIVVPLNFDFNMCSYINFCQGINFKNATLVYKLIDNSNLTNFKLEYSSKNFKVYRILPHNVNPFVYDSFIDNELERYLLKIPKNGKTKFVVGSIIPHDIYYTSQILLENMQNIDGEYGTIIIMGPDHRSRGGDKVTTSDQKMIGYSVYMEPDLETLNKLDFTVDNEIHRYEWSVREDVPFIHHKFHNAKIVPILFRWDISYNEAVNIGKKIAQVMNDKTLLVASIDFAHVMPPNEGINQIEDTKSLEALKAFRKKDVYSLNAEGKPALVAFLTAMEEKGAAKVRILNISSVIQPIGKMNESVGFISLLYSR